MNKQTVMIGVLATSAFVMSGYTLISNTMNDVSRQTFVYALKQEQLEATNKINNLFDSYNSIDESLTYYDAGIVMNMEKIDNNLSFVNKLSITDTRIIEQLKSLRYMQESQAEELLELRDNQSATGGLGVVTGQRDKVSKPKPIAVLLQPVVVETQPLVVEPQPIAALSVPVAVEPQPIAVLLEPVVVPSCPKADSDVDFGRYLRNITFRKSVKFTASFDIQDGELINLEFTENISGKLIRAVTKYLNTAIPTANDVPNCSLPFTISV